MRISKIKLNHFRRFSDLEIKELPDTTRLVVLAGPNGCGKSSLFDAFNLWYQIHAAYGYQDDKAYYMKPTDAQLSISDRVDIHFHGGASGKRKGSFYFRSAYRNDPEFQLSTLNRVGPVTENIRFRRMIESDATVTQNYQRLASQAFEDIFAKEPATTTVGNFRERVLGEIRDAIKRLFPDLILNNLGNPLDNATFRFDKGKSKGFEYKNLSGGEKSAFDLILDIVVKKSGYPDAVYCIDEPEAHMNSRLQGALLEELYNLVPRHRSSGSPRIRLG